MKSDALTLQEKMVKIRSEIPALVKRTYSEEVSYDFTKIDDIFRYLTPAMNRWKVNFEIVSESATKKSQNGDPAYIEFLAYCQMWLYEADLELKWINAENPEDAVTVTIHAIGTHEMPEKAKGSAYTYALKYYLLDKYCIDQGGEDPDMRDFPPDTYNEDTPEYEAGQPETYDLADGISEELSGNIAEKPEAEPERGEESSLESASVSEEETAQEESGVGEEPEQTSQTQAADKGRTENNAAEDGQKSGKKGSDRPAPSRHIMPENGKMVNLPNGVNPQPAVNMTVEEAGNIVCTFGIYNNKCLGELLNQGDEGIKALEWIAYDYRGRNETIRQGARLLLNTLQAA